MITALKNHLFTNWHTMRWVALGLGLTLATNWFINSAPISGFLGIFFLFQAITNTGCLAGQCAPSVSTGGNKDALRDIDYNEIK
jgi:hypothetical protein